MKEYFCLACNGLAEAVFGSPLGQLADFLNQRLPIGVHFNVVGEQDPRPFEDIFTHNLAAAGGSKEIIWIGHSLGAMMAFYQADALSRLGFRSKLFVSIDSTQWGTNAPGVGHWLLGGSEAGRYYVPPNIDHWVHIRQPMYPGGGYAYLAAGNNHTKLDVYDRNESHVALPVTPALQDIILNAVKDAL